MPKRKGRGRGRGSASVEPEEGGQYSSSSSSSVYVPPSRHANPERGIPHGRGRARNFETGAAQDIAPWLASSSRGSTSSGEFSRPQSSGRNAGLKKNENFDIQLEERASSSSTCSSEGTNYARKSGNTTSSSQRFEEIEFDRSVARSKPERSIHTDNPVQHAFQDLAISKLKSKPHGSKMDISEVSTLNRTSRDIVKQNPNGMLVRAARPGHSKAMKRQIRLVTNHYLIRCSNDVVYHYDVDIVSMNAKPTADKKGPGKEWSNKILFELLQVQKKLGEFKMIYDGSKSMISAKPLPVRGDGEDFVLSMDLNGKTKDYAVTIKPVRKSGQSDNSISMKSIEKYCFGNSRKVPYDVSMVLELIFNFRRPGYRQANVKNSFFWFNPKQHTPLDDGTEIWQGYNQNVRFTERGAALIINMAHKVFHKSGSIVDLVGEITRRPVNAATKLNGGQLDRLLKKLKDVRIQVVHQNFKRKYKVQGLGEPVSKQLTEILDDSQRQITVQKYFQNKYRRTLKYPLLPCLHMAGGNGKVYMPLEVCEVVAGQRVQGKLDGRATAKMIKETAVPPHRRFQAIQESATEVREISGQYMNEFGIEMKLEPLRITGRVIEQPCIQYSCQTTFPNEMGTWNVRGSFKNSKSSLNWIMICFANKDADMRMLRDLAEILCRNGKKCGLDLNFPNILQLGNDVTVKMMLDKFKGEVKFFVFVLMEEDYYHTYEEVKYYGDLKYNMPTQCIKSTVFKKRLDDRLALNICLKINAKLGGTNHDVTDWPIALRRESVMVFGADVVHNMGSVCPSIAAVVGTIDLGLFKYAVSCRAQNNPKGSLRSQEIMIYLEEMVKFLLISHYRNNGKRKPEKLLFYRDGVSEGQFQAVLDEEIPMIKKACQSLEKDYEPKITFVIVQKRHQFRMRPDNPEDGVGRGGNVPPGTTVDTDVVDPQGYDFYLCSHEGIQGTSKAAHYTVLYDENGVKPETMEKLTFYMCHLFARCNRSISIPAPVKYADLLAYRANAYIQCKFGKQHRKNDSDDIPKEIVDLVKDIDNVLNCMFFV